MTNPQIFTVKELTTANYRIDIRYDGQDYYGWQRHKGKPTIQGTLEKAVKECFSLRTNVEGSSRTDRGTHALGQVATLQLPKDIDEKEAFLNFNKALPATIEITNLQRVESDFHARSSAIGKCYHYQIWNDLDMPEELQGKVWYIPEELDVERMLDACSLFVGTMDYASFAKVPNYNRSTTIKTIYSLVLRMDEPLLDFSIIGNSFLYKMVRNIIRAIVKVGERRTSLEELSHIIEAKTRQASPGTAPASGLYLDSVFYDQTSLNNAISEEKESEGEQRDE